ncbi:MAG TPA: protein-glutamate O-methyltransferase CheR [Aliidongia sp.]|nr:protein-glutamate O-methyltransferase CheR [Aliidongia sp.]
MSSPIDTLELHRFRDLIARRVGLWFDESKLDFLGEVLQRRLDRLHGSAASYLQELEHASAGGELGTLARELTVGETYFFRHGEQFRALVEVALPERLRRRGFPGPLRLLSAGCASGEEAYSIAIALRELGGGSAAEAQIRGVDLNPTVLAKAEAGRYSSWSLRDVSESTQRRWFRPEGREMVLDETVRRSVRFDARNLAAEDPELWRPESWDVIFCRNVLMYFEPAQMQAAIARIAQSLLPGGFLFLGHAETLRGISDAFHLRHTHDTFYYERKGGSDDRAPAGDSRPYRAPPDMPVAASGIDTDWVGAIRAATERVATLVPAVAEAPLRGTWDVTPALDLLRQERFAEALAHLHDGPAAVDPDRLLLEAALLVQSGRLDAAEEAGRRLLAIDELNAGARYVLALCREHADDLAGAAEQDRVAAYLDPSFAMPRLHLGLLARRGGDTGTARRELGQALILLKREEASRLLLFGGGFGRDALVALCESALKECGGRP